MSNAVVCRNCARFERPEIAAQFEAATRWYLPYMTDERDEVGPISLRRALDQHPCAFWKLRQGEWPTEAIFYQSRYGNLPEEMRDLEQPVIYIGSDIYPAVPLRQEDVAPLLTFVRDVSQDNLDDCLIDSKDLWLALDGVCWPPTLLRERLTLAQRATQEGMGGGMEFRHVDGVCGTFVNGENETLFLLVRDLDHARDAFITLKLSMMESADVLAARAWGEREVAFQLRERLIDEAVADLRRIEWSDQAAIEAIVGPVPVRMATPDDVPFWPVQAPEYVF